MEGKRWGTHTQKTGTVNILKWLFYTGSQIMPPRLEKSTTTGNFKMIDLHVAHEKALVWKSPSWTHTRIECSCQKLIDRMTKGPRYSPRYMPRADEALSVSAPGSTAHRSQEVDTTPRATARAEHSLEGTPTGAHGIFTQSSSWAAETWIHAAWEATGDRHKKPRGSQPQAREIPRLETSWKTWGGWG